ncbi:MAG TPA: PAS domain-containing protein [Rubricoccaceae bacterium]|jgi:PAS domain S-box-containing protein
MPDLTPSGPEPTPEHALHVREAHLALALDAARLATWEWFVPEGRVVWSDRMYALYGYAPGEVEPDYPMWLAHIHPDDRACVEGALARSMAGSPDYEVEFRIVPAGGGERWVEARGRFTYDGDGAPLHLIGVVGDVTERKRQDLALREQEDALMTLNQVNTALAGELALDALVQRATDAATKLAAAQFGAFFYNVHDEAGESYTLYTLSGVPREAFERFPMPRATRVFGPTFRGEGIVRSDDITADPRYGQNDPYFGMPKGHLPVRSYLAVPVISRTGEVHGGLFFGHERTGVFTEHVERLVAGVAAQAAVAIDNARLYEAAQREIAERKEVELALLESEERFRAMTDSAPMLVWMAGLDKGGTYFNAGWLAFTGRTMEQELGNGWTEGIHPDDLGRSMEVYTSHFDRREPFEMEYRLCYHNAEYRWLVDRGSPRFAPDGTFLGYIGSCFDIHKRKLAETQAHYLAETGTLLKQALDSEATLQQIARLAVPGFADWCAVDLLHPDGSIAAIAIAHSDPEKVRWAWELRAVEPVDPAAPTGTPNVIRTGEPELYADIPDEMIVAAARDEDHLRLIREIGFSSVIVVPLRVGDEVAGTVSFINTDSGRRFDESDLAAASEIGRRAGSVLEVARLHEALSEREARFRQLAEALPQIVYTSDSDGRVDYLNRRWFEYTGQPLDIEPPTASSSVIHPDDSPVMAAGWAAAMASKTALESELRLRRADGEYRWFLTRLVPVLDADGQVARWFGTSTDIHAQKASESELAQRVGERTAELERSNRELDQFAYIASHDLKGPLRGIDNLALWIAEDAGDVLPDESRRHLGLLRGRVQRLEQLLESLLVYSRAGRTSGMAEPVDTAALLRDVVEMLDLPTGFTVEPDGPLPTIQTYRAPLELVFRNLISNAAKHHGGPVGHVRVSARTVGRFAEFTVSDDGPGIAPEYHDRVFDLFQTLRPRDEVEGSGMGLAVVKKTTESLGGAVRVESALGSGAAFTFTWPLAV